MSLRLDLNYTSVLVEAGLRWTHVSAHLNQTDILTPHRRRRYVELRGFETAHRHSREHENGHEM